VGEGLNRLPAERIIVHQPQLPASAKNAQAPAAVTAVTASADPPQPCSSEGAGDDRSSARQKKGSTPSFGDEEDLAMSSEIARLQESLAREEAAVARVEDEARSAKRALEHELRDKSRALLLVKDELKEAKALVDRSGVPLDADGLRAALAEEKAKSRRLGEHALRAEQSRRQLLHQLAEVAETEVDLEALAKVAGRAAKSIAIIGHEAPMHLPEDLSGKKLIWHGGQPKGPRTRRASSRH